MIGVYLWIAAQVLIAVGAIATFIAAYRQRLRFQPVSRWSSWSGGGGGDEATEAVEPPQTAP